MAKRKTDFDKGQAKKKETKKKGRTFTRLLHPETGKSYVVFTPTDEGEKKKLKRRAKLDRYWESLM